MRSYICERCHAAFDRAAHLELHRGSRRCVSNKAKAALGQVNARGLNGGGNIKRGIVRRAVPFVKYLRDNTARCKASTTRVVPFVPFLPEYVALDIDRMSRLIKSEAKAEGLNIQAKSSLPRLLAAVLATALTFTDVSVKIFRIPSVPWRQSYEKALHRGLIRSWKDQKLIFNTHVRQASTLSFVNSSPQEVHHKVRYIVGLVHAMVDRVDQYFNSSDTSLEQIICGPHWPDHGYTMNLARCLWVHGGFSQTLPRRSTAEFNPLDGAVGLANGVSRLSGDDVKKLAWQLVSASTPCGHDC